MSSFKQFDINNFLKEIFERGIVRKVYQINDDITMIFELKQFLQNELIRDEKKHFLLDFLYEDVISQIYTDVTFMKSRYSTYFATSEPNLAKFTIYILNSFFTFLNTIRSNMVFTKMDFVEMPFYRLQFIYKRKSSLHNSLKLQ